MNIIIGLIMLVIGSFLTIKSEWFLNNFGSMDWFEDKLGSSGGSRLGYKLIGFAFLFLGIVFITGGGGIFMGWLLSPLLRYNQL